MIKKWRKMIVGISITLLVIGGLVFLGTVITSGTDRLITAIKTNRDNALRIRGCLEIINTGEFRGKELLDVKYECEKVIAEYHATQTADNSEKIDEFLRALRR